MRTDNGGEYMSAEFQDFLKEKAIHHETTVPHSPQQNGVAERMNRTLQEAALSMILHAGVSKNFWAEAVCSAAYIRNRVITTATGVTPYERWYGKKPDFFEFPSLWLHRLCSCTRLLTSEAGPESNKDAIRWLQFDTELRGIDCTMRTSVKSLSVEM